MKKLFALVLTLALVFAIAAPAMAASWGAPTAPTGTPFATSVTLLQKGTDASGATYYSAYPANLGVVAGTTVYFQVSFTVPTVDDVKDYYGVQPTGTIAASLKLKNLTVAEVSQEVKDGKTTVEFISDAGVVDTAALVNLTEDAIVYSAIIKATVKATGDATITSSYGYNAVGSIGSGLAKTVAGVTYTVTAAGISSPSANLALTLGANDLVTGMKLTYNTKVYTVSAGPVFQYASGTDVVTLTAASADYAAVVAAYNAMTDILGFKAGDAGIYYNTANILANFGYNNAATATGTYKGYTSSLTVSDSTTVPNTGDAVSVLGFVMVGLALLATAAVVVKKVRA